MAYLAVSGRNIRQSAWYILFRSNELLILGLWTENPRVGGSIPPLATITTIKILELQAVAGEAEKFSYRI